MPEDANFAATLSAQARARPTAHALIQPGRRRLAGAARWHRVTFAQLDDRSNRYADGLARAGVRRGDRVLYLLWPSADGYAVFYGLLRLGAVPAIIDPRMGLRRFLACVEALRPRGVVALPLLHALRVLAPRPFASAEVLITAGHRWFWGGRTLRQCLSEQAPVPELTAPEADCFIPFTSGSTGPAKAVYYDHETVRQQVARLREASGWREGMKVVMGFAPFVPYALADGLTVILPDMDFSRPAVAKPGRVLAAITDHQAECAFASPIVWVNLARHCERHQLTLGPLTHAITAGAPVPIDLHRRLGRLMGAGGKLFTPYGATEALPVTAAASDGLTETWEQTRGGYGTCVGTPVSGIEVRIIRVTDEPVPTWSDDLCVPQGAIGEIVVGGPIVSPAYLDRPDDTARSKIHRNGQVLHRMGDLGRLDATGRLWFCGRKSHRIETSAGMLAPVPIENIFNQHPRVFRTAVVGVGPAGNQIPVACVEMEEGETFSPGLEAELLALAKPTCFRGIVRRFLPHRGFPVDARHNSKIRREELAGWATRVIAGEAGRR